MEKELLPGSKAPGASQLQGHRAPLKVPRIARQGGAGTVEYLLLTGVTVAALLTPFGEEGESIQQRLMNAIRDQQEAFHYAARLPAMPTLDAEGNIIGSDEPLNGGPFDQAPTEDEASDSDEELGAAEESESPDSGEDSEVVEDVLKAAVIAAGGWEAVKAASQYICGQMMDENPIWTREDLLGYQAADAAYHRDLPGGASYNKSKDSFAQVGVEYPKITELDGFSATLYKMDGTYVLAFRGSDDFRNDFGKANIPQGLWGNATQYDHAVELASELKEWLGEDFLIAGHSLGGGLAAAAAYETGMDAITFNAAGLHDNYKKGIVDELLPFPDLEATSNKEPGHIRHHYIRGEVLTVLQKIPGTPTAGGTQIAHSAPCDMLPLERHGLDAFSPPAQPGPERPWRLEDSAATLHNETFMDNLELWGEK
ncbi:hypothetical protein ACU6TU_13580 [Halomonas sp. LS-001]